MKIYYAESVPAEKFLRAVLKREYGISDPAIVSDKNGKPALKDSPLFFNLSHSGGMIALAVGEEEVGLDIEERRERKLAALRRRLTPAERREDFYRMWTAKEAYVKFCGETLAALYRALTYENGVLFRNSEPVSAHLYQTELNNLALTLCTARPVPVELVSFKPLD